MRTRVIVILSCILLVAVLVIIIFVTPQQQPYSQEPQRHTQERQQYRQAVSTIGNCQVFPSNNIWNYDISHLAIDSNSANYIANIGENNALSPYFGNGTWGIPYNIVTGAQPSVPIHFTLYGSESDAGPYPIPPNALIEAGRDHHVLVVDSGTCKLYELWEGFHQ